MYKRQEDPDPEPEPEPEEVEVENAVGDEDTAIALAIDPGDAAEVLIEGVPDGAVLSAGTDNGNGTWTLTAEELEGLTITPPTDSDVDFTLQVTGDGEAQDLVVTVNAVADAPTAEAQDFSGQEDTAISLDLNDATDPDTGSPLSTLTAALSDTDGSESLSITIGGVPDGAVLSAGTDNGDGTWTVTLEDLNDISITPPQDFNGEIPLTLNATSTEADGGDSATTTVPFTVTVTDTIDGEDADGFEDQSIALNIDPAGATSIELSNIPDGATLTYVDDQGATQTLSFTGNSVTLSADELNGLAITPPADSDEEFTLSVTADGFTDTMDVTVTAVADVPTVSAQDATGGQGAAVPLDLTSALTDLDGSETLSVTISDVPTDAALSAGTDNGDGTWTLSADDLVGLTITPPPGFSGDIPLSMTATATEADPDAAPATNTIDFNVTITEEGQFQTTDAVGDEDNAIPLEIDPGTATEVTISDIPNLAELRYVDGNGESQLITITDGTAVVTEEQLASLTITPPPDSDVDFTLSVDVEGEDPKPLEVAVNAVADAPTATAQDETGNEDEPVALNLTSQLTDTDLSEVLSVTLSIGEGVPEGTSFSAGTDNGDGTWTFTAEQLDGLTLTPPPNWDGEIPLTMTATSTELDGGDTATTTVPFTVTINPTGDFDFEHAEGVEDTAISLTIDPASINTETVGLSDIPADSLLQYVDGTGATVDIEVVDGAAELSLDQLNGLQITPPPDSDVDFTLTVTANNEDEIMHVIVNADADVPTATAEDSVGLEDNPIDLDLSAALTDIDGSESLSLTIQDVPDGAILSAGTDNGDGSWSLAPGQLTSLTITPPVNFEGDIPLTLVATSTEADGGDFETTEVPFTVTVEPDLSKPDFEVTAAEGYEDNAIALDIDPGTVDVVTIGNVPTGAVLSAGTDNGDGTWTVDAGDLAGITITPPQDSDEEFTLSVTGTDVTGITQTLDVPVTVHAVADRPDLDVTSSIGDEDTSIPLTISSNLTDTDGSETLSLSIDIIGIPEGAKLTYVDDQGDPQEITVTDNSASLTQNQLNGLSITPPQDYYGDITLQVTSTSTETADDASPASAATTATFGVTVRPVNDDPEVTVTSLDENGDPILDDEGNPQFVGNEDETISLNISAEMPDPTTVELSSVLLGGIEPGSTLTYVDDQGATQSINYTGSVAQLSEAQLNGLSITPPPDFNGEMDMTATAFSEDGGVVVTPFSVDVAAIADLDIDTTTSNDVEGGETTATVSGVEDTAIDLNISAASDEAITISSVPDGAELSAGTDNGNGTWTLTAADLEGLTITPPGDSDTDFDITVTAQSPDGQELTGTISVSVAADADAPSLDLAAASGSEDTAIPLSIDAEVTDSSETLSISISDIPDGATLTYVDDAGATQTITVAGGSADLTADQLNGLSITPPADSNEDFQLSVSATTTDGTDTETVTSALDVSVTGDADAPTATVQDETGTEDTWIQLNLDSALSDTDGSESLTITITDVPDGALLAPGTDNGDGTWSVTPAELPQVCILPPDDFSGEITMTLNVTATENDGDTETTSNSFNVTVEGDADAPTVTVSDASGTEDTAIPLSIDAALTDTSETLSITIGDIPQGATLTYVDGSNDTQTITVENGSADLTPAQLNGLSITPPADSNEDFQLSVSTTSADGTDTATTTSTLDVSVTGDADAPTLDVSIDDGTYSSGGTPESDPVTVDIANDGALTFSGASSYGEIAYSTGEIEISADDSGTFNLQSLDLGKWGGDGIVVKAYDENGNEITSQSISMGDSYGIGGTVDFSDVSGFDGVHSIGISNPGGYIKVGDVTTTTGDADGGDAVTTYDLDVTTALTDTDGSETLSVTINDVQDGVSLSAGTDNGDGTWSVDPADLDGLEMTVPEGTEDFSVTVSATATENDGDTETTTQTIDVGSLDTVAETPTVSVDNAAGLEDGDIPITINAALSDTDGSETLSVTIGDVPDGATLSAGTDNGDGTWTIDPADLDGLSVTPPADSDADFTLSVSVTATETLSGDTSTVTASLDVSVEAVADAPTLETADASGTEDNAIALNIDPGLGDTDGSETMSITISGVPDGAILSAGTANADGTWTLDGADLSDLTITPPPDYSGSFDLGVTATASGTITVDVAGVADEADLTVSDATGTEDQSISLNIDAGVTDSSESLSITISGVPDGATLSAGTENQDGTWTLTEQQLDGLSVTPAADSDADFTLTVSATTTDGTDTETVSGTIDVSVAADADTPTLDLTDALGTEDNAIALDIDPGLTDTDGSESLSVTIGDIPDGATLTYMDGDGATQTITVTQGSATLGADQLNGLQITPADDYSGSFDLSVTATATEADGGDTATTTGTLTVDVAAVADEADLTVTDATGTEDQPIALDINAGVTDASESLSITISGVPDGATLNAGTENQDGTWTLSADDLDGLTITPPADSNEDFQLSVTATTTDGSDTETVTASLPVSVAADADTPTLNLSDASGTEDNAIALNIDPGLGDTDGSESLSITISGVPDGATLNAGTENPDGTWTLDSGDLQGLTITPPDDYSGSFDLSVTATATEADGGDTATTSGTITVDVAGDADQADLTVSDASGTEDQAISLNIDAGVTDSSESLSITISGVPDGATLSAGTENQDGIWTLTEQQLDGLSVTPPADSDADFTLTVSATTTDGTDTETVSGTIDVSVAADADAPTLSLSDATGTEDNAIALNISSGLTDTDGSESLSITISGVPDGATLNAGTENQDDTWTLSADDLNGLTVTPAADSDADFTLTVSATSTDGTNIETVSGTIDVSVAADADTPTLNLSDASGTEDNAIALNISSGLTDTDGSESLSITISGVPDGATLNADTENPDGTWTLEAGDLQGLAITPPADSDADFTLSVTATSTDGSDTATTSGTIDVSVAADADAPTLDLSDASGDEETPIALNIDPGLTDTDGSESVSITISGVPNGATLSAGTENQDGTWTLTEQQLDNLTITPADDYSGSFDLTVTATATEADGGDTATTSGTITVDVADVAEEVTLTLDDSTGVEDNAIALNIDTSGAEAASITISGVPEGATLSAGTENQDGTWTLTDAQLDGLEVTPPADSDADFTLTVTATSADGTETTGTVDVTVTGDADAPTLSADATYSETEAVATTIDVPQSVTDAATGDNTVTVSNVPNGATLSAGTDNGDGTWTLAAGDVDGLTVTPADGSTDAMSLSFEVSGTGGAGDSLASENFDSGVSGWSGGATSSGGQMKLQGDTSTSKTFDFGSEHGGQTVTISFDFDAGSGWEESGQYTDYFNVSANGTEVLDTTEADSSSHSFTVTLDENGQVTLEMSTNTTASSEYMMVDNLEITAGDDWSSTLASETVDVTPDPENLVYDLDITSALTDTDGSETLSVTVDDLPDGAVLSAGTENQDGSWTLEAGDLSGLTMSVPDGSGAFNLAVSATATEADGDTNTVSASVSVAAPDETADGVTLDTSDASGSEDQAIALDIDATLVDTDGSETVSITISGVPDGATLNAGTENQDGTWTLEAGDLDGLMITPPADSNADFTLTVSATTTEESTGDTSTSTSTVDVSVAGVADAPTLSVELGTVTSTGGSDSGGPVGSITVDNPSFEADSFSDGGYSSGSGNTTGWDVTGYAGAWDAESGQFTDQGSSDGTHGVPDGENVGWAGWGGTMSQTVDGTFEADRSYELSVEVGDASGTGSPAYEIRLYAGDELVGSVDQSDFPLTDQQFTTATVTVNGSDFADDFAGFGGDLRIELVHPGGDNFVSFDTVELSAADIGGDDGYTRELDITSSLTDTDGSETLSITVSDVPDGVTLSAGTENPDGTWTLSSGDLDGLTMTVPADTADFDLSVSATATESDGNANTVTSTVSVTEPDLVSEGVTLSTSDASGSEDRAIALDIGATLTDTDGSETVSVTISGVPDGATLSAGTDNQDGTWTLDSGDLSGLTILPAEDSAADFSLTVTATATETTSGDTSTTTSTVNVTVDGIADAPELAVTLGSGTETGGGVTPAGYWNVDETSGSTFYDSIGDNDGAMHGSFDKDDSGVFGTTSAEFRPGNSNEYIEVDHSDALKPDNGAITMWFNADDVSGRNALASSDSSGNDDGGHFSLFIENGQIRLRMQGDNSEGETNLYGGSVSTGEWNQVTVTWGDDGARIYVNGEQVRADENWTRGLGGNENPWTFGANQWSSSDNVANNLKDYFDGHMDDIAIYDQQLTADQVADLYEDGVTDMMNSGDPSMEYPLTITTALADTDGSESLSITVDGLPDGATLSAGTENQDGTWSLESGDLSGLTVTVPSGSDDFMLNVSATATDEGGDTRTATQLVQFDTGDDGFDAGTTGTDSADTLTGSSGDDVISGEGGADDIDAGDGDDTVMGGSGDDIIDGGDGADLIDAGTGADTIDGGAGDDHVMGGDGDDLFIFGSGDGADYFNGGDGWSDTVQLEGVDSGPGGDSGWTLQVDEGTTYTETESGVEFDAEASGSIVLADGSELTFDNVEKLEW